jgi:integrase
MTIGELLEKWLAAKVERGALRGDTADEYRDSITRFLIPYLGHHRLVDLRGGHITQAYDAMRRDRRKAIEEAETVNVQRRAEAEARNRVKHSGRPRVPHLAGVPRPLGPLTIRRIHTPLSSALASAKKAGHIPANPAVDAELPRLDEPKVVVWDAEQVGAFLDAIEGHRMCPLYHLAAYTGMRRGELVGLSWDDVDLEAGRITVRWQITDKHYRKARAVEKAGRRGDYRSRPKTKAGEDRLVDIDDLTVEVLRAWRDQQRRERRDWGRAYVDLHDQHGPLHLVFTRENGAPLDPTRVTIQFAELARRTGLPHLKFHGLRHFAISLQLEAGVDVTVIAMRVGHTSPALIRKVYGHLIGTVGKRAAEATASLVPRRAHQPTSTSTPPRASGGSTAWVG